MLGEQVIYAGDTPLASTLQVQQTGPLALTVGPAGGTFTTTGDVRAGVPPVTYTLAQAAVFRLTADPQSAKRYLVELGQQDGVPDVLVRSQLAGEALPPPPTGWGSVHWLAELQVPAGATDLAAADGRVFTVRPGFPPGTTAADWLVQTGSV